MSGRKRDPKTGRFASAVDEAEQTVFVVANGDTEAVSFLESNDSEELDVGTSDASSSARVSSGLQSSMESITFASLVTRTRTATFKVICEVNFRELLASTTCSVVPSPSPTTCAICLRESTSFYNLHLETISCSNKHRKQKFGAKVKSPLGSLICICQLCEKFCDSLEWKFSWPAVFCTLILSSKYNCNGYYFYKLLPVEMRQSWYKCWSEAYHQLEEDTSSSLFQDYTVKKRKFLESKKQFKAVNLKQEFNKHCFPFVKCPAGCSVPLFACDNISFVHLLNYFFPSFRSFKADAHCLRGMRKDFLRACQHFDTFVCSPCLEVTDHGLFLKTCQAHKNFTKKNVHVPTSPLGNLLHPQSDRFAPMATKVRNATPFKMGSFSHTYSMATSKGGYDGISTLIVTNQRNYNVKSDQLLPQSEPLVYDHRRDIRNFLTRLTNQNEIDENMRSFIANFPLFVDDVAFEKHLSSGAYLTMFSLSCVKLYLDCHTAGKICVPPCLLIVHHDRRHGAETQGCPKLLYNVSQGASLLVFWHQNLEIFDHILLNVCNWSQYIFKLHQLSNNKKKKGETISRAISLLQQHLQLYFSVSTATSAIHQAFETMPLCASFYVPFRQLVIGHQMIGLFDIAEDFDFQCFVIVCSQLPSRLNPPPFTLTVHSTTFHLVSLFSEGESFFFFRYGIHLPDWWSVSLPDFTSTKCNSTTMLEGLYRSWNILLYVSNNYNSVTRTGSLAFLEVKMFALVPHTKCICLSTYNRQFSGVQLLTVHGHLHGVVVLNFVEYQFALIIFESILNDSILLLSQPVRPHLQVIRLTQKWNQII